MATWDQQPTLASHLFKSLLWLSLLLAGQGERAWAQPPAPVSNSASQVPLQTVLLMPLEAGKLVAGTPIATKARFDWSDGSCHLRAGSIITGRVMEVIQKSKESKGSSLALLFDQAQCDGQPTRISLNLYALVVYEAELDEGRPLGASSGYFGSGSTRPKDSQPSIERVQDLSVQRTYSRRTAPTSMTAGQVFGLNKVTLKVGTGPAGSSVLTAEKGNLRLTGDTELIFVPGPQPAAEPKLLASASSTVPPPSDHSPAPLPSHQVEPRHPVEEQREVDETELCGTLCNAVTQRPDREDVKTSLSLATAGLGSIPHDHGEYAAFDFESTLTYLDAETLLFTYDPHNLRRRLAEGNGTETMRTIRAVLLDAKMLTVRRVVDWQVQGDGQYLWPAGSDRILVHIGHQLRLLGPKLETLQETSVPGRLVFVSLSPSGDHIAVGTFHERYPRELYDTLFHALHHEPEEDIDVQLLDSRLTVLLTARQTSTQPIPVLADSGELRVHLSGPNRWRITEYSWTHAERVIATTTSECRPELATPLPEHVFVVGCSSSPAQNWYRMLRLDGQAVLKGHGSSQEIEQASSSRNRAEFAVRVVRTQHATSLKESFRRQDLEREEIGVYRAENGREIFSTSSTGISLAEQSFALSPSGRQLAVLTDTRISLYALEAP